VHDGEQVGAVVARCGGDAPGRAGFGLVHAHKTIRGPSV
jgi:hypothetical protein